MSAEKFPVDASNIMMFARAIGDPNAIYYDEAYAKSTDVGEIIAPPTFVQSSAQFDPDWQMRPRIGEPWMGSASTPTGVENQSSEFSGGRMHAEQRFEYHRPLAAGDELSSVVRPGKVWEKEGRKGGKLRFEETITEFSNQDGELTITATNVVVFIERSADDHDT